jgi:RNA recognition motif-containing protein
VTFESEEDAKRVIKESENLIIKNRKLNVSEAVKKQPPFGYGLCS